jgi:hypothetical protein
MFRWMLEGRCATSVFEHGIGMTGQFFNNLYGLPSGWSKVMERFLPGVYQKSME